MEYTIELRRQRLGEGGECCVLEEHCTEGELEEAMKAWEALFSESDEHIVALPEAATTFMAA
jgi:hypothetical protein